MALKLIIGKCCILGNFRENNEDAIEVRQARDFTACLVADGMGGQAAGEIASQRTIEVVSRALRRDFRTEFDQETTMSILRKAIVQANEEIIAMSELDRDLNNMGTTIVSAVWSNGSEMHIASVGDSRAYLVRQGTIELLTEDDDLAHALMRMGQLTPEEARKSRIRNYLLRFIGSREVGEGPEVKMVHIQNGDRFMLCTDGLHGSVEDDQLLSCIRGHDDVQRCAEALCQLALDSGSRDNVSCIVIEVVETGK